MPKSKKRKPKKKSGKRSKQSTSASSGGGMLMGMRGGFKNVAKSVSGQSKKNTWFDYFLTMLTAALAVYLFFKIIYPRFF